MIEAVFVRDNPNVAEPAEENQRAKLELLFRRRRSKACPKRTCVAALKVDSYRLESTPNESGTIESGRSVRTPRVAEPQPLIDRRRHQLLEFETGVRGRESLRLP